MTALFAARRFRVFICALLAGTGCSSPELQKEWWVEAGRQDDALRLSADSFAEAASLIDGIDDATPGGEVNDGDRALFGVEIRDEEETTRFILRVEVKDAQARATEGPLVATMQLVLTTKLGTKHIVSDVSEVAKLVVTRHSLDGTSAAASEIHVTHTALVHGFAAACRVFEDRGGELGEPTKEEAREVALSMLSLQSLMDIVQSDAQLSSILQRVARTPSLTSIIARLGVDVAISMDFDKARRVGKWSTGDEDLWRIPLVITANDEPAVLALVDLVEPRPPWHLSAGVVRLTARRPGDVSARLVIQLLAARSGSR